MARLPVIAAAVLAIAASAPVISTSTSPASAQEWRDKDGDMDRDLRDLIKDRIRTRHDLRELIDLCKCKTGKIYGGASASASASGETETTTTMMEAGAEACAGGSPSA